MGVGVGVGVGVASGSGCGCGRRSPTGFDVGQNVLLRHATTCPGAGDRVWVDAVLGSDARDHGRDEGASIPRCGAGRLVSGRRRGERSLGRWLDDSARGRHRSSRLQHEGDRLRRRRCIRGDRAGREDRCEEGPDLDRLALGDEQFADDTVAGARDLGVDLVRRDLEQRLVTSNGLTRLLEPLRDRSFRHGDTHLGHHDLDLRSGGQSGSFLGYDSLVSGELSKPGDDIGDLWKVCLLERW